MAVRVNKDGSISVGILPEEKKEAPKAEKPKEPKPTKKSVKK